MTSLRDRAADVLADVRAGLYTAGVVLRPAARRSPEIVVVVGLVLSVLGALVLVGAARNDAMIDKDRGRAVAEVLDGSSSQNTFVRFTATDGAVLTPEKGVFYPRGLEPGQLVRVEYDRAEPELVRVEGRDWTVGLLPVVIGIVVVWLVCAPAAWALARWRRRRRSDESPAAAPRPTEDGSTSATSTVTDPETAGTDERSATLTGAGAR